MGLDNDPRERPRRRRTQSSPYFSWILVKPKGKEEDHLPLWGEGAGEHDQILIPLGKRKLRDREMT